ncbi:MAG: carboxypeptidase-like regulatory domain-containing protein, partial [Tannerella sp.]|nr:carboxypeptidase-like regulatory domain-containing protein [Tannerella sp.]
MKISRKCKPKMWKVRIGLMKTSLGAVLTLLLLLPLIPVRTNATESRKHQSGALLQQQDRRITGTVKDAQGEAISGATVIEKGTTNGTATDGDGNFTLTLTKENATLQ